MSSANEKHTSPCADPIDPARLADYWIALLPAAEEEAVETHLLGCDRCGARLGQMIALAEALRTIAREGRLRMIVSETFLPRAAEDGVRIRQYAPPSGGSVACTVTAEDDILVGRLAADVSGAGRVDLSLCNERGVEQLRLPDIPVHAGVRGVIYQESTPFLKAAPSLTLVAVCWPWTRAAGNACSASTRSTTRAPCPVPARSGGRDPPELKASGAAAAWPPVRTG